ncbi:LutC/YkgG family protein [Conservatibacter flavescens]|uniref:Lactate utilization protein C n=1 Tax=Conservatibacter flavescens TaxID=28161 RepID=A0A2M8S434_9PAST|nr:lactate utilization protein C [Conservatibacter flavescens]PJG85902.1 lactate utilization protein C [Conservatibacter flavescens]
MNQQNREDFLNKLAQKMGKTRSTVPEPLTDLVNHYPAERLTHLSPAELCEQFVNSAKTVGVDVLEATEQNVAEKLLELCEKYGGGDIIINQDSRLDALGLTQAVQNQYTCYIWSPQAGYANIQAAEKANIGIVHAEYGLTESGGFVLFSQKEYGRSVSLLPEKSIVILRKSQVVPRVAQVAKVLHDKAQQGERMPSCINIISGPSSTADIELIKVVGVHGPVAQIYLLIDDL